MRVGPSCTQCASGDYRVAETLVEGQAQTDCRPCSACVAGQDYETSACLSTRDRVCTRCRATCNQTASEYKSKACTTTSDLQCSACVTKCPAGMYMNPGKTRCDGTTSVDTVLGGCSACLTVASCEPGQTYLSKECDGTDLAINTCNVCGSRACDDGFYSGGCGGLQPTQCLTLTRCPEGQFLNQWSATNDGKCQACRNCTAEGKRVVAQCTQRQNTGCGGEPCDEGGRCASTANTARFCSHIDTYNASIPVCGVCPVRVFCVFCVNSRVDQD